MMQPEQSEKKKGFLGTLPKIGKISQLVLIIAILLAILIPLIWVNHDQELKQNKLNTTLNNLRRIVGGGQTPRTNYEAELAQVIADTEAAKAAFPSSNQAPEILDSLLELADLNDIYVTRTGVTSTSGTPGPVLTVTLGFKGQIPKFQNFLLALGDSLPSSQIKQAAFTVAKDEKSEDTGTVIIQVLCYEGND